MTYAVFYIIGILMYFAGFGVLFGSVVIPMLTGVGAAVLFLNGTIFLVGSGIVNAINTNKEEQ